jgi:hypothetical protein
VDAGTRERSGEVGVVLEGLVVGLVIEGGDWC